MMNNVRFGLLGFLAVVTCFGCRGTLPSALTSKVPRPAPAKRFGPPIELGSPAHEFAGKLVFGPDPRTVVKSSDLVVVTRLLGLNTPGFFFHNKLYPKVRWVQYVAEPQVAKCQARIKELADSGEPTEGFSLISYDPKTESALWRTVGLRQYNIVRNNVVIAQATDAEIDHLLLGIIGGKTDLSALAKQRAAERKAEQAETRRYETEWPAQVKPYIQGKISDAEFSQRAAQVLDKLHDATTREVLVNTFLGLSYDQTLADLQPVLTRLNGSDNFARPIASDLQKVLSNPKAHARALAELKFALKDPHLYRDAETCRLLAESALALGDKSAAKKLCEQMIASPEFAPRYTRPLKKIYEDAYADMMSQASH